MYFPDLSPWPDQPTTFERVASLNSRILSVGWLERDRVFPVGPTDHSVYVRLVELSKDPWEPFAGMGLHGCSLCQFDGAVGRKNLFIPSGRTLYVAPELITHYIACHHYEPPEVFRSAVLSCPVMRSQEYRKALIATGTLASLSL